MERLDPYGIEPGTDGDRMETVAGEAKWVTPFPFVGAILLEPGQTVAQYEAAHGVTVPVPTFIFRKA